MARRSRFLPVFEKAEKQDNPVPAAAAAEWRTWPPSRALRLLAAGLVVIAVRPAGAAGLGGLEALVRRAPQASSAAIDLSDLAAKARRGLAFMDPEARLESLDLLAAAGWSPALAGGLEGHLRDSYAAMRDLLGADWPRRRVEEWGARDARVALVRWRISSGRSPGDGRSIAILDRSGDALYDSRLVEYAVEVEPLPQGTVPAGSTLGSGSGGADCRCVDSDSVQTSLRINGLFGSVTMTWGVNATAEVPPYLTQAVNDGALDVRTDDIIGSRSNPTGIPPVGDPVVYFGNGGKYNDLYGSSVPFESTLTVIHGSFGAGTYGISADEGGFKYSLSVGVDVKGVGLGLDVSALNALSLSGEAGSQTKLHLQDRLYAEFLPGLRYRGMFNGDGSLRLSSFIIRSGDDSSETGQVSVQLPVQVGYAGAGVFTLLDGDGAGTIFLSPTFIRGDALVQPSAKMTAPFRDIQIGEQLVLTVRVTNGSQYVDLASGQVSLDLGSLQGHVVPLSPAVLDLGSIGAGRSQSFTFTVKGVSQGIESPQAEVSVRWGSPVPPEAAPNPLHVALEGVTIAVGQPAARDSFRRSDSNGDGNLDLSDPIATLAFLFQGTVELGCPEAADSDDSGKVDITDPIHDLAFLFQGGPAPAAPFPSCGADPTGDALGCPTYAPCGGGGPEPISELLMHEVVTQDLDRLVPDASGNGHPAYLLRGGPSPKPQPAMDRFGNETGCLEFVTNPGNLNGILTLGHLDLADRFTLAVWIYTGEGGDVKQIIGQRGWMAMTMPQSRNGMRFSIVSQTGETFEIAGTKEVPFYEWHFFVAVVDYDGSDSTLRLYRDAEPEADPVVAPGVRFGSINPYELTIGARFNCSKEDPILTTGCSTSFNGFKGRIDDVRIYNGPLSGAQVLALYQVPAPGGGEP